jgi:hypothetical protein
MNSSLRYNWPFARNFPPSVGPEPPIQYVAIMNTNVGVFIFCIVSPRQFQVIRQVFQLDFEAGAVSSRASPHVCKNFLIDGLSSKLVSLGPWGNW